jgi:ribosomal protein L35AE/L33A
MTMDAARPFYRLGSVRFIGAVPAQDFQKFLTDKFLESGFEIEDPSAVRAILEFAEEVPYNVQMLAHTCWNELRDRANKRPAILNMGVVEASLQLLVRQYDPFYTQIWSALTSIQQKTLIAVIKERGVNLQSLKVAQFVGKGASTVQRALGSLTERNILREEEQEGRVRMRFEDPFFAQWIRAFPGRLTGFIITPF